MGRSAPNISGAQHVPQSKHEGPVTQLEFLRAGHLIASASTDGSCKIWDTRTEQLLATLPEASWAITELVQTRERALLLTGDEQGVVRVWDSKTARLIHRLDLASGAIRKVEVNRDGSFALVASRGGKAVAWSLRTGDVISEFLHGEGLGDAAWNQDGKLLATSGGGLIKTWRLDDGQPFREFADESHEHDMELLGFYASGRYLAGVSAAERILVIFDLRTGKLRRLTDGPGLFPDQNNYLVSGLNPNGRYAVTAGQRLLLWELDSGELVSALDVGGTVSEIAFSHDGKYLAVAYRGNYVKVLDSETMQVVRRFESPAAVASLSFGPSGRRVAAGAEDGTIRLWSLASGHPVAVLEGRLPRIGALALSNDGRRLLASFQRGPIVAIDVEEPMIVPLSDTHEDGLWSLGFAGDERYGVAVRRKEDIRLWKLETRELIADVKWQGDWLRPPTMRRRGVPLLVTAVKGADAVVLNALSQRRVATLVGANPWRTFFSNSGRLVVTLERGGTPVVWNTESGKRVSRLGGPGGTWDLAFHPNGRRIVTANRDGSLRFYDASSGTLLRTIKHGEAVVERVAWSPNGRTVVYATEDRVFARNVKEPGRRILLDGFQGRSSEVKFSLDGDSVALAEDNRCLGIWSLSDGARSFHLGLRGPWAVAATYEGFRLFRSINGVLRATRIRGLSPRAVQVTDLDYVPVEPQTGELAVVVLSQDGKVSGPPEALSKLIMRVDQRIEEQLVATRLPASYRSKHLAARFW